MVAIRPLSARLKGVNRQRLVLILDWTIEYGIYLMALVQFQSKGEAFRSIGLYVPLVAWFIKLCLVRETREKPSPVPVAFLFFVASLLLSALLSIDPLASLRGFRKSVFKSAILFFVISQNFTTWEKLRRLGWVLACSGCIAVVAGFLNYVRGYTVDGGMVAFGTHRNGYASILGYLIPFIIAYTVTARVRVARLFFGGFFLLSLAAMLLTVSRGGWISLMTSLGIWTIFLLRSRTRLFTWGAVLIATVMLITSLSFPQAIVKRTQNLQLDVYTLRWRIPEIWVPILEAIKDRPLLGWGPTEVIAARVYPTYYKKVYAKDPPRPYFGVHSFYISILFYGGSVALLTYFLFASIFLIAFLKMIMKTDSWSQRSIMVAVLSSFVAVFLVHGIIEAFFWWNPFGLILGFGEALSGARPQMAGLAGGTMMKVG